MINSKKILGLIVTIAAISIFAACNSSTATIENKNKKGPVEETAAPAGEETATDDASKKSGAKTYALPAAIISEELKTLDGKPFKLSDYKGKVVVLNQWATWCVPCREEIPELIKLREEMKGQGVEIIGLTLEDERNTAEEVKRYAQAQQINYPIVWGSDVFWSEFGGMADFKVPASFIINKEGKLTAIFVGFNRARTPKGVRKAITDALNAES